MEDIGKFKVQFGSVDRLDLKSDYAVERAIKEVLNEDPEIQQLTTQIETVISKKLKVVSEKTGDSFVPTISIKNYYGSKTDLPIKVSGLRDGLLAAASQPDTSYDPRMLGPVHMGLLELEYAGGKKLIQEMIDPQWREALGKYNRFKRAISTTTIDINRLILAKFVIRKNDELELALAGRNFLDVKRKENAPNLNSPYLKKAFFNQYCGLLGEHQEFYCWVLERFDFIEKLPEQPYTLTKHGQRFLEKQITKYLLNTHTWRTGKTSDWAKYLKADHILVNSVPGIGATLLSKTQGRAREYLKYLLSTPLESLITSQNSVDPYYSLPV